MDHWRSVWNEERWCGYLEAGQSEAERVAIRRSTHTGRPLGTPEFVAKLECVLERRLAPQKAGRRRRSEGATPAKELMAG